MACNARVRTEEVVACSKLTECLRIFLTGPYKHNVFRPCRRVLEVINQTTDFNRHDLVTWEASEAQNEA